MRSNRTSREQQAAVSARLTQLSKEFVAGRIREDLPLSRSDPGDAQEGPGVIGAGEPAGTDEWASGWGEEWKPPDTHTRIAGHRWPMGAAGGAGERPASGEARSPVVGPPQAELPSEPAAEQWPETGDGVLVGVRVPAPTRIRPRSLLGELEVPPEPEGSDGQVAGKHLRQRGGLGAGPWGVVGRLALGPAQLALVTLTVVAALLLTGWWLWRTTPSEIADSGFVDTTQSAQPLVAGLPSPAAGSPLEVGAEQTGGASTGEVVVDVAGKVRRPGIAVLGPGSRVVDALKMAGGARRGVDLTAINLARLLVDGEQILVGVKPAPGVAAGALAAPPTGQLEGTGVTGADGSTPLVAINTAGLAELETLPQVGPVTAAAIMAWREENGDFTSVDELLEVDGIGEVTLGRLAPLVTL